MTHTTANRHMCFTYAYNNMSRWQVEEGQDRVNNNTYAFAKRPTPHGVQLAPMPESCAIIVFLPASPALTLEFII